MSIKSITRSITLIALFLIPIFPLIVANSFFFPFITGKAFYFRTLVEVGFAAYIILAFVDARYRPRLNALSVGVTIFALVTLAANLLGVNPIRSITSNFERMEGWMTVIHLWMFFMMAVNVFGNDEGGKRMWHRWLHVELAVALTVGIYGLEQLLGLSSIHQGSTRIDASLGNAAYMAVYMLINAGIVVYLLISRRVKIWTLRISKNDLWPYWLTISVITVMALIFEVVNGSLVFNQIGVVAHAHPILFLISILVDIVLLGIFLFYPYYSLAILFPFLLFETGTRGTIIGLIGGIILALLLYAIFAKNRSDEAGNKSDGSLSMFKNPRWIAGIIIIVIFILGGIFWLNRNSSFVQHSDVLQRLANISWSEAQGQARNYIWPMAVKGFTERPVLGWGQENFNYIFNANYSPKMWNQEQWFDRAHSVYLDWLTASGVVGLAAYLGLYVLALMAIWKSDLSIAEKSVLTGLGAGYAAHNVFVFDNLASYVLFFALLGFAASQKRASASPVKVGGTREVNMEIVEYVVAPVVIVALVASLYFFIVRPVEANTRLITALQSCGNSSPGSVPDPALFDKALSLKTYVANQEIREQLISCAQNVISSQQIPGPTKQAFFDIAMKAIQDQVSATPKDARMYVLGGSFLDSIGQFPQALPVLTTAHLLSPDKQTVDFELATAEINMGQADKAVVLLRQAYESDPTYSQAKSAYIVALIISGREATARELFGNDPSSFQTPQIAQVYANMKEYGKSIAVYRALIAADPSNVQLRAQLANVEYSSGMVSEAVKTLQSIEKDHPEYKDQIETVIKQMQK